MNRIDLMLRERNLQAIFDQHNKVRLEVYVFGGVALFGLIMLLAIPWRYCVSYWPPNVPCLKYAYGYEFRVFVTALYFTCLVIGGFALFVAILASSNLPQIDDTNQATTAISSDSRPANAMIQTAPGRFVLPRGISQAQWRKICALVAEDWYFSRRITDTLKDTDDGITNEQYTDLLSALKKSGAVIGNDVPVHMQHVFTSPTLSEIRQQNRLYGENDGL